MDSHVVNIHRRVIDVHHIEDNQIEGILQNGVQTPVEGTLHVVGSDHHYQNHQDERRVLCPRYVPCFFTLKTRRERDFYK